MYIGMYTYSDACVRYMCRRVYMKMYIYISSGVFYTYTNNTHRTLAHERVARVATQVSLTITFLFTFYVLRLQSECHCIDDSFYRPVTLQNYPPHSFQPRSCVLLIQLPLSRSLSLSLSVSNSLCQSRRIDAPEALLNSSSRDRNCSDLFAFVRHDLLLCVTWPIHIRILPRGTRLILQRIYTAATRTHAFTAGPMDSHMWRDSFCDSICNSFCNSFTQLQLRLMKSYEVAAINRLPKNIGLFCKRALQNRPIFCKRDLHVQGAC